MNLKLVKMAVVATMTLMAVQSFAGGTVGSAQTNIYCQDAAVQLAQQELYRWAIVADSSPQPIDRVVEITNVRRVGVYNFGTTEEFYVDAKVHSDGRSPLRTGVQLLLKASENCRRIN